MSSLPQPAPRDAPRTLLQYAELHCFREGCTADSSLKVCSRCKRVKYCSADHQNEDYSVHKSFCKAYAEMRASAIESPSEISAPPPISSSSTTYPMGPKERHVSFMSMSREMEEMVFIVGARKFGKIHNYLIFLEPRCLWCYKTKSQLEPPGKELVQCERCKAASFCGMEHRDLAQKAHNALRSDTGHSECDHFSNCVLDDKFSSTWASLPDKPGPVVRWAPDRVLQASPAIPNLPRSWKHYFEETNCPYIQTPPILRTMLTPALSMPLTILDSMKRFGMTPESIGESLVIHVIGAEWEYEFIYGAMAFEEIMHQIPTIKDLLVEFIGPAMMSLVQGDSSTNPAYQDMDMCPNCTGQNKKRRYRMIGSTWHQYYISLPSFTRPHIAIAFNSGLHELTESWKPTVRQLLDENIPCVFTSYNAEESARDAKVVLEVLQDMKKKPGLAWPVERNLPGANEDFTSLVGRNMWSSEREHLDYFSEGRFWFENAYTIGVGSVGMP